MRRTTLRTWAVRVTYASIAVHPIAGAVLPLIVNSPLLEVYHRAIETAFRELDVPPASRALLS